VTEATGLVRVLERVAPAIRADNARGTFSPSSFATPLSVAAYAVENDFTIGVTATSNEPKRYESQSPRWSAPTLKSPCGRAGTRIRSSASVPTTRPWRPGHCCAGASPRVTLRESSSRRPVRSRRSSRPKASLRRCQFVARRTGRDEFIASLARFGYRRESLVETPRRVRGSWGHRRPLAGAGTRADSSRLLR